MEIRLGVKLLERSTQGVIPTDAGKVLLEHAAHVADEENFVLDQLRHFQNGSSPVVRIAAGEGFSADLAQNGLRALRENHPDIRFEVYLAGTDALVRQVVQGEADIGIAYNPIAVKGIRSIAISRQPLCAVVPLCSPLLQRPNSTMLDMVGIPVGLLSQEHAVRQLVDRAASDKGVTLQPVLETNSITMLIRFVCAGLGSTLLPSFSVKIQADRGELGIAGLEDQALQQASAHVMVRARRRLPKSVETVATVLSGKMSAFS